MTAQTMLRQVTGLNLSRTTVERAVRQRMAQQNLSDPDGYLQALTPDELVQLIELVVVPESWLFRDAQAFAAATQFVQARLLRAARPVRILSIPCAAGEEPYSMAMALRDAGIPADCFTIDAIDLSPSCIARAQSGIYGRNAFRSQDMGFRARYFSHIGEDDYQINDSVREQVRFQQGNLLLIDTLTRASYYDVVFCRNLLIYFDQPTTKAAIAKLAAILADDGMLFAGYAEVPAFCRHGFTALPQRQAFALKKDMGSAALLRPAHPYQPMSALKPASRTARATPVRAVPARPKPPAKATPKPAALAAAENLLEQARKLADLGLFEEADLKCRAHLTQVPDAAGAYFILGILSEHARQMAAAEDCWRRCLYLQPDHYEAMCHLALLTEHNGNAPGAALLKARAARIFKRLQAS
ncbi:MAG: protein-glutamate O-methyltransferase CheR [Oxalobacteraceae bacterium]